MILLKGGEDNQMFKILEQNLRTCDASKWCSTTAVVPGLPPLARDAVVPARHSLGVLSSTRAPLRNPRSGSC